MTDSQGDEKAIRVLTFSGKQEDWDMWSKKFLAMAKRKKYKGILLGTTAIPTEEEELKDDATKKARDANERAYSDLILSCNDEVSFGIVDNAVTDENPSGDARLAWTELVDSFDPEIGTVVAELKREFQTSRMKLGQKPHEWVQSLEKIRAKLRKHKKKILDEDIIIHVLNNMPKAYESTVERLEVLFNNKDLTVKQMKQSLSSKHKRLERYETDQNEEDDTETADLDTNRKYNKGFSHLGVTNRVRK